MSTARRIADALYDFRRTMNLTQESFAHELGVTVSTVNRWEKGWCQPSRLALLRLKALGFTTDREEPARRLAAVS